MPCKCRDDERVLALVAKDLASRFPELVRLDDGDGWEVHPELGAIRTCVGSRRRWSTLAEFAQFLRNAVPAGRLDEIRITWIEADRPIEQQLPALLHAEPVSKAAPLESTELLSILKEGRLESWFQPIVHADSREVWGYECLVRGRNAEGQTVDPSTLLGWARQEDLLFMFDRVCRETHLANARDLPPDARVLINFLPTTIYVPEFCLKTTVVAADRAGIDPSRIVFEVVESEKTVDRAALTSILDHYRKSGFGVALDDIGAGYSGLTMLADLDPDIIKLDRDLVVAAPKSTIHMDVCRSLAKLAKDRGKLILAEGIETDDHEAAMMELGVDLLQGFRYGYPAPLENHRAA